MATEFERQQFKIAQDLSTRLLYRNISRRDFLKRATAAGLSSPTIAMILAACGGDDPTPTPTTAAGQAATPTPVPTARPVIPGAPTVTPGTAAGTPEATATVAAAPTATTAVAPTPTVAGDQPEQGGRIVIGMAGEPPGLDPGGLCNVNCHTVVMHMFDPLMAMDTEFNIYPWLATSWRLSDDLRSYIFELRDDVFFHNGDPLTADDVAFTFDRIKVPETNSTSATAILGPIYAGSEVVDERTVQVNFEEPYAPFLGGVTTAFLGIVSRRAAEEAGADFATRPVGGGTGPFIFQEWVQTQHTVMTVNPDYNWAPELFSHNGRAYLDEIRYQYVPESGTRQALLDTGEAQVIDAVPPQNVAAVESNANYTMYKPLRTGGPKMVDLNTKKAPLDDLLVRQALNYAFNRQELIDTIFYGVFEPATVPLAKATFGYDASLENFYPYDPERAAQLLDEAGWVMDGEIRRKDGQEFRLLCQIGTSEEDNAIAQVMQAQWLPLGIAIDIEVIAGTALTTAKREGQHHIGFKIAVYQDPDILGIYFHPRSIGGFNYTFWEEPELADMLDAGIAAMDAEERLQIYSDIQRYMMENALLIPIYNLANLVAMDASVQGIVMDTAGYVFYYDAWLDES
jgi:peptide/nickel transport system substrate-binding protein